MTNNTLKKLVILLSLSISACASSYNPGNTPAQQDYERGLHYFRSGEYQQAAARFRSAVVQDPNHEPARRYLERAEENLNEQRGTSQLTQREEIMQRLAQQMELRKLREELNNAYADNNHARVREAARQIFEIYPNDSEAMQMLQKLSSDEPTSKVSPDDSAPVNISRQLREATRLFDAGSYEAAMKEVNNILIIYPSNKQALGLRDKISAKMSYSATEITDQTKYKEKYADYHYNKALQFLESEDYVEAILNFQEAMDYVSEYKDSAQRIRSANRSLKEQTREAIESSLLGRVISREYNDAIRAYQRKRYERALENFQIIEQHVRLERALRYQSLLSERLEQAENRENAESLYQEARVNYLADNHHETHRKLKAALKLSPDYFEAKDLFDEVDRALFQEERIRNIIASAEEQMPANNIEAIERAQQVFDIQPGDRRAEAVIKRAASALGGKSVPEALATEYEAYLSAGQKHLERGEFNSAIEKWSMVLFLNPPNKIAIDGIKRATDGRRRRSVEEAAAAARAAEAARLAELQAKINNLLEAASRMQTNGRHIEAIERWEQVIELDPNNAEALRGIQISEEAIAQEIPDGVDPDEIERIYRQGLILHGQGNYEAAIREWERVLLLAPNHERAKRNIEATRQRLSR
ncbi:MAG: hypothetical protein GX817_04445 [Elusimicrobia bacterium]|nr:hypothetical protein [Elusimicrobiota bacterium]